MLRIHSLLLVIFLTITGFLSAVQYENMLIEEVEIVGNVPEGTSFDEDLVRTRIKTREGDVFSQTVFDNDLKNLANEYDRVEPTFTIVGEKLHISLKVSPRPMIRSITFDGNKQICTEDLQKELGISICTVCDRLAFNKGFHKLKAYYVKKGFFEAELSYDVELDPLTNEVDISICINEGRSGMISFIYFHNFCDEEEDEILEMMVTKKYNAFLYWMGNEGIYNEEAVQYDQTQIINYMQNRGYADAVVKIEAVDSPQFFERIHLHITLERGERYTLGNITFDGNELYDDEEIRDCFLVKEGEVFSPEALRETAKRIENLYGSCGYIDANVAFEPSLEMDCGCVYSVDFSIEEGEEYRVGLIKVFGNCTTQTNVILHETLLIPGEVFNTCKLELTEARLRNIGYFSSVNVYAVRTEANEGLGGNYRDVHIEVEEKQTGRFGISFGYSTVESLFGTFSVTEKNFNSAGLSCICGKNGPGLRGGGEYLSGEITLGQKSRSYTVSWTKPYFMDSKWSVGFDITQSSSGYISDDYTIKALGYNLRANYEINSFTRFGWHYRIRNSHVNLDHKAHVYFTDRQLYKASRIHGLISATGVSLTYDSTDRFEYPSRGFRSVAEMEFAGLGGDHTFMAFAYLNSYYYPLWRKGVIKFRADMRFIQPFWKTDYNHIPLDERLYLGGENTVRGYKAYKLGPQFKDNDEAKGGISMQIGTIEYNQFFHKRVNGFLFFDAGQLSSRNWHFGRINMSVGVGARLRVLDSMPPITLGVGFPVNPRHHDHVKNFFFSFGGSF